MLRWLTSKLRKGNATPLRERWSLRSIMTWINILSILSASLVAGYYALTILYQNKLSDTWAIMFLENETQGTKLAERLDEVRESSKPPVEVDGILDVKENGSISVEQGAFSNKLSLSDFNIEGGRLPQDWAPLSLVELSGQPYLVKSVERSLEGRQKVTIRRLPLSLLQIRPAPPASRGSLYLLTREGSLVYSSNPSITEINVVKRQLVQKFISTPIRQGQMELTDEEGERLYGFFSEIPKTNIVMFSEVTHAAAMAPVRTIVGRFIAVLVMILVGAVVLLQLPLSRITNPLKELADLAKNVGQGNFDVKPTQKGLGELSSLNVAFSSMATGLVQRDRRLEVLMRENVEKARLESELAIARNIQENLLPSGGLPKEAGLGIAAEYISAAECAGDWYQYAFDQTTKETVIVVADVSGHGAGASMFTAIIASIFEHYRRQSNGAFQMIEFAREVNETVYRLGRKKWHVTMAVARFVASESEIDLMLAGHPVPMVRHHDREAMQLVKLPYMGSSVLGAEHECNPVCRRIPFPKGSSLLFYTDGLTEAADKHGKLFSRKRAREAFLKAGSDPDEILTTLLQDWKEYLADRTPLDDVCVVAVKAA